MTISYDVKDLFKLLWKKKKTIMFVAIICGLLAIPTANVSYNTALEEYSEIMQKGSEREKKVLGISTQFIKVRVPEKSQFSTDIIVDHTVALMTQDIILKSAWKKFLAENSNMNYDDFKNELEITAMSDVGLIQIQHQSIEEKHFSLFVDQLIKETVTVVPGIIDAQFNLEKVGTFFEEHAKSNINEIILKPPSKPRSYIKIIGTAGLGGIVFTCFIILLLDFLRPRIKSPEDVINNYCCDGWSVQDTREYLGKIHIKKAIILALDQNINIHPLNMLI